MDNTTASAPESAGAELPQKIKVFVVQQAVKQDGKVFLKNQVLEVTPERAAALGDFVKPYVAPAPKTAPQAAQPVIAAPSPVEAPVEPAPEPVAPQPEPVQHTD